MARTATLPIGFEEIDFKRYARNAMTAQGRIRCWAMRLLQKGKTVEQVAEAIGRSRQSVHTWVKWLRKEGVERLVGKVKGRGRKAFVQASRDEIIEAFEQLQQNRKGGRCTVKDFAVEIERCWGKRYGRSGVYELLKRVGMSWVSARSKHPEVDVQAQEAFKKTSGKSSSKRSPRILLSKKLKSGFKTNTASANKAR